MGVQYAFVGWGIMAFGVFYFIGRCIIWQIFTGIKYRKTQKYDWVMGKNYIRNTMILTTPCFIGGAILMLYTLFTLPL